MKPEVSDFPETDFHSSAPPGRKMHKNIEKKQSLFKN